MSSFPPDLRRAAAALVPVAFLVLCYLALSSLSSALGLPSWLPQALFWVSAAVVVLVMSRQVALARLKTAASLRAADQIVDEPLRVEAGSGVLVLASMEALRAWRGGRQPAEGFVDLDLSGPRALEVSRTVGLDGPYLYDVPVAAADGILSALRARLRRSRPAHSAAALPSRVDHRTRALRAKGLGPLVFNVGTHEVLAVKAAKVDLVRSWLVTGELDALDLVLDPRPVTRVEPLSTMVLEGDVLAFGDLDALEDFDPEESRDGRYELVVHAEAGLAAAAGGYLLDPGLWGWSDVTVEDAAALTDLVASPGAEAALIPHSADFHLAAALALEPVARVELPRGLLHAVRTTAPGIRVVSLGYNDADLVRVRLHFQADPEEVYRLPEPSFVERVLSPVLMRRKTAST